MKAIILARVSDKKQDSNDAQVSRISNYIKFKGLTEWQTHKIEESSTKRDRKRFREIIKTIKKSKEEIALVVDTVDRLQRSFKESVMLDELRRSGKVQLHFYRENLVIHKDSNSADILRWDMAVMFAKSYVLQLSDNVKRKFGEMLRRGKWIGPAPIGYINIRREDEERWIIPDPERAHHIKWIFERYATGNWSIKKIKEELDRRGFETKNGVSLAKSLVHTVIKNPFYAGTMVSKGRRFPHKYKPIISEETFRKCQKVVNSHNKKKVKYAAIPFLFGSGLLSCEVCGAAVTAEKKVKPSGREYIYYSCTGSKGCKRYYISESKLVDHTITLLKKMKRTEKWLKRIVEGLREANSSRSKFHQEEASRLQAQHRKLQNRLEQLPELLMDGRINQDFFDAKRDDYAEQLRVIEVSVTSHLNGDSDIHLVAEKALSIAIRSYEIFQSSEIREKRSLLGRIFQNSTVNEKSVSLQLSEPFRTLVNINDPVRLRELDSFRTLVWEDIIKEMTKKQKKKKYEEKEESCEYLMAA